MRLGERCDEIIRLIDEMLFEIPQPPEASAVARADAVEAQTAERQ